MTDDLHDLTDAALRRHLAERLGWRLEKRTHKLSPPAYWFVAPGGFECELWVADQYAEQEFLNSLPDWPGDVCAALEAALDHAQEHGYALVCEPDRAAALAEYYDYFGYSDQVLVESVSVDITPERDLAQATARALAELLAKALEAGHV